MPTNKNSTILHLIDTTGPGGAETIFTQLAHASRSNSIDSIALVRGRGWVFDELKKLGIKTYIKDCKGSFNYHYLFYLIKLIRRKKVNLIQSHLLGSNVYGSLAGILTFTPVISTFHGIVDISPNEKYRWLKLLIIYFGSFRVIAVTELLKLELQKHGFTKFGSPTDVIQNGIDTEKFNLGKKTLSSLDKESISLGCLGNVRPAKNYSLALDFLRFLRTQNINATLTIAGDDTNELAKQLKKEVVELKLEKSVHFKGFIDDSALFLSEIDIFLMTSLSEGHPLALNQAISSAVPVITTPSGVEKIFDRGLIFVSNSHTIEGLAECFTNLRLLSKDQLKTRMVAGRNFIVQNYGISTMCNQYLDLYRQASRSLIVKDKKC